MRGKLKTLILACTLGHSSLYPTWAQSATEAPTFEVLADKRKRLLKLQEKNQAILERLSDNDFSARIKIKSNLVIISTELQNIQDQIDSLKGGN